jgi:hypothetical protein
MKKARASMVSVEEDGDEIFTPIPKKCVVCWNQFGIIGGIRETSRGFMECEICGCSYGKVKKQKTKGN